MLDLPEAGLARACERAAHQNVLAAVNPDVFPGYWSVCADGQGFGYGNTYPSLDGHQMTDALLWLGQADTVKANCAYVRSFQRPNGQLPLAILPGLAGKCIGNNTPVDPNGGLYRHWVPGDPLRALAGPTYIQNADVIFRFTQDREWLAAQLPSVNLAADYLATLVTAEGAVGGAGYYVERPTRVEYDGVAQCHAADAFRRVAELNRLVGKPEAAKRYDELAQRIAEHFRTRFWVKDRFAEYIHPARGLITSHGLTDTDWAAIALGLASPEQTAILWPQLKDEKGFDYGGMPAGIATRPEAYEPWEFTHPDRQDLAAMGRVWYLECQARARMGDADGLLASLRKVCTEGEKHGYFWRERYNAQGGFGAEKYCEYPANLIRIVQRYLLGVEHRLDGALVVAPTVPEAFWAAGFGQTLTFRGRILSYRMQCDGITGEYRGDGPQRVSVRFRAKASQSPPHAEIDGRPAPVARQGEFAAITLPPAPAGQPCRFAIGAPATP
ncbi:MAG TPA: hypothetical protein PLE19_01180 [Planctomycetota bacterium]|nr:hypothetical protein [Planctomycetota bacterium]HRR79426.1 hypothetical protein [Planctomycetota bacterium]HRT95696.1 hypothetical protein [Planctomycetota bacterium]